MTLNRENEQSLSQSTTGPSVIIDTSAEIISTSKTVSNYKRLLEWSDSWRTRPADADEYYYMVWTIYTTFSDSTQYFDFTLTDTMDMPDSEVVGYSFNGRAKYTPNNTAYKQKANRNDRNYTTVYYRYDSVLTRHKRSSYPFNTAYVIENKIEATVTPIDGVDPPTSQTSKCKFYYDPPKYHPPTGHFWSSKYSSGKYNFTLDDLRDKTVSYADNNLYFKVYLYGYPYPWTLADGHSNTEVDQFGKKNVKYELTDDKFTFFGDSEPMTADDFEINSLDVDFQFRDAVFDVDDMTFKSTDAVLSDDEFVLFEAKFGSNKNFVTVGRFYPKTKTTVIEDAYRNIVLGFTSSKIQFADNAECVGFRFTSENAHYFTHFAVTPRCRVKLSDYILNRAGDEKKVYIENTSIGKVYSGESVIFSLSDSDRDYLICDQRHGQLSKECTSTQNNKLKKYVSNNWELLCGKN